TRFHMPVGWDVIHSLHRTSQWSFTPLRLSHGALAHLLREHQVRRVRVKSTGEEKVGVNLLLACLRSLLCHAWSRVASALSQMAASISRRINSLKGRISVQYPRKRNRVTESPHNTRVSVRSSVPPCG